MTTVSRFACRRKHILLLTTLMSAAFFGQSAAKVDFPKTLMFIGKHEFRTELANTPVRRSHGLMFRTELADDQAMLFTFPNARRLSFWMKNTKIALDILYFDQSGRLLEIKRNLPPCRQVQCPTYPTQTTRAKFAVEVRAGVTDKLGIETGMKLYGCGLL